MSQRYIVGWLVMLLFVHHSLEGGRKHLIRLSNFMYHVVEHLKTNNESRLAR